MKINKIAENNLYVTGLNVEDYCTNVNVKR